MTTDEEKGLRKLPAVEVMLQDAAVQAAAEGVPRRLVVEAVRTAVERVREQLVKGACGGASEEAVRQEVVRLSVDRLAWATRPHFRKAINATGIILHTGLGRAVLPPRALRQIQEELSGYSVLQLDVETGQRSQRDARIEWLLKQLTGAGAATVVNNNAAATMIVLNTVAKGREVIVSRGQLVEIGGSFRLPDVMAASGAHMVEVGTTNKTHPADYENAITENTAAILRVHPSNYRVVGFTAEVPLSELVAIARAHEVVLIDDVGAGALIDFSQFGFAKEPTLPESVAAGADVATASADKLIGASQGGIILGRSDLVNAVRKNPIARMVRVDKMTLAALEATLMLFLDESLAMREVPTLRMLRRELPEIARQAKRIVKAVAKRAPGASAAAVDGFSQMGSGSLPEQNLPTCLVAIETAGMDPDALASALRQQDPPVFTRIQSDRVLLDPRTLQDGEEATLIDAVVHVLNG